METDRTILPNDPLTPAERQHIANTIVEVRRIAGVADLIGIQIGGLDIHLNDAKAAEVRDGLNAILQSKDGMARTDACGFSDKRGFCGLPRSHEYHQEIPSEAYDAPEAEEGIVGEALLHHDFVGEPIVQANDDSPERVRHVCGASGFMVGQDGINDVCPGCDFNKTSREDDEPLYSGSPCILECVQTQAGHGLECPRR